MEEVYHCPAITSIGGCFGLFGGLGEVPITSGVYPVTRSSDYQNWLVGFFICGLYNTIAPPVDDIL